MRMNIKLSLVGILCLALAGCGHQYQIKPLKHVKKHEAQFCEKKDNIELRVKKLKQQDIQQIFNDQYIIYKNVSGLILTIKNNSPEPVTFDGNNSTIQLLSAQQIKPYLSKNTPMRIVLGLIAIPGVIIASAIGLVTYVTLIEGVHGCSEAAGFAALFGIVGGLYIGVPIVVATTGYHVHDSVQFNTKLAHDLKTKVLTTQTIAPRTKSSTIIFTKNLPRTFIITFTREKEQATTFTIQIPEPVKK